MEYLLFSDLFQKRDGLSESFSATSLELNFTLQGAGMTDTS